MLGILSYKTWLIEPMFAARMAPIVLRHLDQGSLQKFFQQNRQANEKLTSAFYQGVDADLVYNGMDGVPPYFVSKASSGKKVAIVTLLGAITKNGDACSYGMRDYQNALAKISGDESISGVVLHFNNAPGGTHDGTPEISHIIKNFSKPTVAFVDGMAASAHYYMASQTSHIMMNSLTDSEVGSIGSLIISENIQNMVEAGQFPAIEIIRAPQSKNKALFNYIEELPKNVRDELNEDLRLGVDGFISAVKAGRGESLKDDGKMFTGVMYPADEAIKLGLADSKGTLRDAINRAASPVKQQTKSHSQNSNTSMKLKVSSFFGKKKEKKSAEGDQPAAEDNTPRWTDTMVFNTDGSGDGAFCLHADAEGNDRKFETKIDANQGNEPPTDSAVTEDDNWSLVPAEAGADDAAPAEAKAKEVKEETSVTKLNAALKAANMQVKEAVATSAKLNSTVASLQNQVKELQAGNAALQKKLDEKPAGHATTVVTSSDEPGKVDMTADQAQAEKYANALHDNFL